jgi:hypothetical protein
MLPSKAVSAHPCTQTEQKYTPAIVSPAKQSTKATKYDFKLTANGGIDMNLKKLPKLSIALKNIVVGATFATQTVLSGAA